MIKLFRKIRQDLMAENKIGKYLKYAVGEIVLVVIGILIALQLNTWKEGQKNRKLEKYLLENIAENLHQNADLLSRQIISIGYYRRSGDVIISAIENKLSDQDSLENYFHLALMNTSDLKLPETGYNMVENKGFEIIQNQALKKEIMIYFEATQAKFQSNLSWGSVDKADREKFVDEHFIQSPEGNGVKYQPFDLNALYNNNYFKALVYKTDLQRGFFSRVMQEHLNETQRMIEVVNTELNKN